MLHQGIPWQRRQRRRRCLPTMEWPSGEGILTPPGRSRFRGGVASRNFQPPPRLIGGPRKTPGISGPFRPPAQRGAEGCATPWSEPPLHGLRAFSLHVDLLKHFLSTSRPKRPRSQAEHLKRSRIKAMTSDTSDNSQRATLQRHLTSLQISWLTTATSSVECRHHVFTSWGSKSILMLHNWCKHAMAQHYCWYATPGKQKRRRTRSR